jgi:hypothetical protein
MIGGSPLYARMLVEPRGLHPRRFVATLKTGLPLIRMIVSFGKVTKWLAITTLGLLVGFVLSWESLVKIVAWFRPAA